MCSKYYRQKMKRKESEVRMTRLLVATMFSITILTTPKMVINFLFHFFYQYSEASRQVSPLLTGIGNLMFTSSYSLNFYLYCLANRLQYKTTSSFIYRKTEVVVLPNFSSLGNFARLFSAQYPSGCRIFLLAIAKLSSTSAGGGSAG